MVFADSIPVRALLVYSSIESAFDIFFAIYTVRAIYRQSWRCVMNKAHALLFALMMMMEIQTMKRLLNRLATGKFTPQPLP